MNNRVIVRLSQGLLLVLVCTVASAQVLPSVAPAYAPGVVLVEFRPGTPASLKRSARLGAGASANTLVSPHRPDLERLRLAPGRGVEQAIKALARNPNVRFAEPDFVIQANAVSNDPYFTNGSLWGMYGDTTTPANTFGSQAAEAWAAGHTGSRAVYVGVIDEGIDFSHPDLAANIWVNPFEVAGNGADDDGNGYIDDVRGWDFFNNDASVFDGNGGDTHGTHVSGTIGAVGGNASGVAGVNWAVTLISLKFLGSTGGYTSGAIAAVEYLNDLKTRHNLNIVASSNSWGGGGYSQALRDAINRGGDRGILFVAAAGNNSTNTDGASYYPSNYNCTTATRASDCVLSVASITSSGGLSSFSNYGAATVDLGAPGSSINSTLPGNTYGNYSGTSMATPHVSGAIALCESINPALSAAEIRELLMRTVAPTASLNGKTVSGGRLDAGALASACTAPSAPANGAPSGLTATATTDSTISLAWLDNSTNETRFELERSPAGCGSFTAIATLPDGTTSFTATGLQTQTEYCFRVRAANEVSPASDWSAPASATTLSAPLAWTCAEETMAWVDTASGQALSLTDDGQATVAMPFGFSFYGLQATSLSVSANGYARLDAGTATSYQNVTIPSSAEPNALIAPFWDDLNPGSGGAVRTFVAGTAPSRRMVVSWEGVPHFSVLTDGISVQMILEEATGQVVFNYLDTLLGNAAYDSGASATAGIENLTGTSGIQLALNQSLLLSGSARRCSTSGLPPAPQPPLAPTGLTASAASATRVNLGWSDVTGETDYVLERAVATGAFAEIATLPAGTTTFADATVAARTSYQYRLKARNGTLASPYSATVAVTTPDVVPLAPTGVSATLGNPRRVTARWSDASLNEQGFQIGRASRNATSGLWGAISTVASVGVNAVVATLNNQPRGTHRYYVRATNSAGPSAWAGPSADIVIP